MKIVFKELILKDFKGLRYFHLVFDDNLTELYADNGEGKTTIVHALFWLFFGKDAFGATKFELFPLDEENNQIPNTIPTVELKFLHGAKENVYTRSKDGSKTNYTINGAKVTATEYSRHVSSVVTEELFSALLSPVYFGDNYSWQKQRDTILGNMRFENTVIEEFEFEDVAKEILEDGIEPTLTKYDKQKKELEKSKEQYIGTRDYLANKLKDVDTSITQEELVKQKELKETEIKNTEKLLDSLHPIQTSISDLERLISSQKEEKASKIRKLERQITELENEGSRNFTNAKNEFNTKISKLEQEIQFEVKNLKSKKEIEIKSLQRQKEDLLNQYKERKKEINEVKDTCSLCGQKLDEFEVANQKAILGERLEEIKLKGSNKASEIEVLEVELSEVKEDSEKLAKLEELKLQLGKLKVEETEQEKIDELKEQLQSVEKIEIGTDELVEINLLKQQESDIRSKVDSTKLQSFRNELSAIKKQVEQYEVIVKDKLDLDNTVKKLRDIMSKYDDVEEIIEAVKQYRTDYAQMVADVLNSKLDRVKIKTFIPQGDKPPKETFEISMDGVPYSSLNSAGKIEAGIELIQLLSLSLEIIFPIIIDNKESVTKEFDVPNQLITLSVEKGAKLCSK